MKRRLLNSTLGGHLYQLKERLIWQRIIGRGISEVDVSRFGAKPKSDISDHLNLLALILSLFQPKEILELGTRGGESTRVLHQYCEANSIVGKSIDLSQSPLWLEDSKSWVHFPGDDTKIGNDLIQNQKWPNGVEFNKLDFIFIDTSHEYLHTKLELQIYVPLVRNGGLIVFHDTNLSDKPHRTIDGRIGYGWNNERGVTRAIEEYFSISMREQTFHSAINLGKIDFLFHVPWNNGFTILKLK